MTGNIKPYVYRLSGNLMGLTKSHKNQFGMLILRSEKTEFEDLKKKDEKTFAGYMCF